MAVRRVFIWTTRTLPLGLLGLLTLHTISLHIFHRHRSSSPPHSFCNPTRLLSPGHLAQASLQDVARNATSFPRSPKRYQLICRPPVVAASSRDFSFPSTRPKNEYAKVLYMKCISTLSPQQASELHTTISAFALPLPRLSWACEEAFLLMLRITMAARWRHCSHLCFLRQILILMATRIIC